MEVVPKIELSPPSIHSEQIVGDLNYHGLIVPVIDFSMIRTGRACQDLLSTRIILTKTNDQDFGIIGLIAENTTQTVFSEEMSPANGRSSAIKDINGTAIEAELIDPNQIIKQITINPASGSEEK